MDVSECVEFSKKSRWNGYGLVYRNKARVYAHRAAWEEVHGPIPARMHIHHECGNKLCVNVEHLMLVTPEEHGALELKRRPFCRKGHPYTGIDGKGKRYCLVCRRAGKSVSQRRRTAAKREVVGRRYTWRGDPVVVVDVRHTGEQKPPLVLVRVPSGDEIWRPVQGLRRAS